ncbi:MAG: MBL fold metallo-hydrolase [Candidatus Hadarchaeota archaeon]
MIEILPLGGMNEVGKNMTAVGIDGRYIVVDMGIRLDSVLAFEDAEIGSMSREELININAIPDDGVLRRKKVKAIVLTHGHLDHIGAVGKLAGAYDVPIYGTPFTMELTKRMLREEKGQKPKNEFVRVAPGGKIELNGTTLEFIPAAHSILQTAFVLIRGDGGSILMASDFKLDDDPLIGQRTDEARLRRLGREGLFSAMIGAIRLEDPGHTLSEAHAKKMLEEKIGEACEGRGLVITTTFSSHIVRLKSIVDVAFKLGRTPVLVGRSLHNYTQAATSIDLVDFPAELRIHGRPNSIGGLLKEIDKKREEYVLVCTGHQGEPTSVLSRIADGRLPLEVKRGDDVIFSASVIPNPVNQSNREMLEAKLTAQGARVHRDVHVSGHGGRADTATFIEMINPEHIIPCHGTPDKLKMMLELGKELGYSKANMHTVANGVSVRVGG